MIIIYMILSCLLCCKVKKWFDEYKVVYEEKNLFNYCIDDIDIEMMLYYVENGFDDIILICFKVFKE